MEPPWNFHGNSMKLHGNSMETQWNLYGTYIKLHANIMEPPWKINGTFIQTHQSQPKPVEKTSIFGKLFTHFKKYKCPAWNSCPPHSPSSTTPWPNVGGLFLEMSVARNPPKTTLYGGQGEGGGGYAP